MEIVRCKGCGKEQELCKENFRADKRNRSGFNGKCKECEKKQRKDYKTNNREKIKQNNKKYRENNKEKIATSEKEYREKNANKLKEYRKEYKKIWNQREFYRKNRNILLEKQKKYSNSIAKYSAYFHQLFADDTREIGDDILEVRCKHCHKWTKPTNQQTQHRVLSINGRQKGESHFYCSQECKDNCEVYRRTSEYLEKQDELNAGIYTKHKHEGFYTDNDLSIWSRQVRDNANNECEICGKIDDLQAHHILPKSEYPEQALDPLNGVCLCDKCHKEKGHSQNGCKTGQLRKCDIK